MERTRGVTFEVRAGIEYMDLGFPKKINNWKNYYFYMKESTLAGQVTLPPFSIAWSQPRNLNVVVEEKDAAVMTLMKT
jgi:hypothetical protein